MIRYFIRGRMTELKSRENVMINVERLLLSTFIVVMSYASYMLYWFRRVIGLSARFIIIIEFGQIV